MLPKKPRRQDADTLIWEYLEGDISPSRSSLLSKMLKRRAHVRERFVDSAVLHAMLRMHFDRSSEDAPERTAQVDVNQDAIDYGKPRQRSRRASAA